MRTQLVDLARAVVDHVDLLKRQIRHDVTPTQGQVEELFDLGERLHTELALNEPALPCSIPACARPAAGDIGGRPYCTRCSKALRSVTKQVLTDAPEIARAKLEAMVAGRAPWPEASDAGSEAAAGGHAAFRRVEIRA